MVYTVHGVSYILHYTFTLGPKHDGLMLKLGCFPANLNIGWGLLENSLLSNRLRIRILRRQDEQIIITLIDPQTNKKTFLLMSHF